jgi:hypothetical protein
VKGHSIAFFGLRGTKALWHLVIAMFVLLCMPYLANAQGGRGSISGTITDPSGGVVPGAHVELLSKATGVKLHTVTSGAGLYTFVSLNPGVYQLTLTQTGFAKIVEDNIVVTVDQVTGVDITLRVGTVSDTVEVVEGAELVEASNSTVGTLIPSEAIERVPLLYRNVYDLIQLSPGVIPVNGSPNSSDSMQSVQNISVGRPGVDVSADTINGSLVGSVYYMLDGSPLGIAENNSAAIIPAMNIPEDGIEEVRVETQNTSASYQSGGAGVISLVSKSGANALHGDAFGVFRPDALSSNDSFNKFSELSQGQSNTPPDFHRYQSGGAISGPIKKDKLFFFGDYEYTTQQQFEGLKTYTVPTSAERTGDFSALLNNVDPTSGLPAPIVIYDPTQPEVPCPQTNPPTIPNPMCRQPFPGNIITNPNPIALLYLSKMPKCNYPDPSTCDSATSDVSPNYAVPGLDPFTGHRFDIRVDWVVSEKQRIFTRFSYDRLSFATANVFPSGWDPDYAQNLTNGRNVVVADDLTLSNTTVLQLRYSFTRHHENQGGPPSYSSIDLTTLGFPASLASAEVIKQLPFMTFGDVGGGVGGTADYNIFQYASENSDVNSEITKIWGKHTFSTGFEWMKRYLNVGQPPAPAGSYNFDISSTDQSVASSVGGSDFASFLVGMGNSNAYPGFTKDVFAAESNPYYAAFFEDTYHAMKSLTITAGLRWDIFGGRNERHNRQEYFDPNATNTFDGVSYTGAEIFNNSSNRSPYQTNMHDFGPRLAISWQPIARFVVRAGAGFYYGPSTQNVGSALINTDGFSSQTNWQSTCNTPNPNPSIVGNTVFNGTAACAGAPAGSPPLVPGNFTGDYSLSNPFPNGVVPVFTTPPAGLANDLGITLSTVLHSQNTPTTYNYNFGLEYELPHQVVVSAGYVGSRGLFLPFGTVDLNQLDLATIAKYGDALCLSHDPSCMIPNQWAAIMPATNFWYGSPTVPEYFALEKYPQFAGGSINTGVAVHGYPAGDSEYSSLQTKVQKRLTAHFTALASFTWGKILTDDGNPPLGFVGTHNGGAQDWRDLKYEHSISPQDVKYVFTGQASYDLPLGPGRAVNLHGLSNAFAGGWTINGILYLSTGVPIASPLSGTPNSPINQRADMICDPSKGAPHTASNWFNINCFVQPGTENGGTANLYIPGTAPAYLDNVRTRGARNLDLSIYKAFKIAETKMLRFDVSLYNVANYAQYGYPSVPSVVGVQTQGLPFGLITTNINTPRQFQFGARFIF